MGNVIRLLSSRRIVEILEKLSTGSKTKKELRDCVGVSSSHLAQILYKMSSIGLIKERGDTVSILPKGEYMLNICRTIKAHEDFLGEFGRYINMYILEDIPEYLVARFYELREISIVERCADIYLPHEEFVKNLAGSKAIYGYASVFFPQYINLFSKFAEEGKNIEIIVSEDVIKAILERYKNNFKFGLKCENVKFYVSNKNFRFSFVVTDNFFSISFFLKSGIFDYKRDFMCFSKDCIRWGLDLFNYVKQHSSKVDIEELKESALNL